MADNLDTRDVDQRTAVATDAVPARVATTRRRLMLGAAAVLPSVVTLPSGARTAVQSFNCTAQDRRSNDRFIEGSGVERFTAAPDEWLRKRVFSGRLASNGRPAYCTTWDQPSVLAIATLETAASGLGYKALPKTTWWNGQDSFRIGDACKGWMTHQIGDPSSYCYAETVDNISPEPDHYGLVFVDEAGLSSSLEPGPGMVPVRATCYASLVGDRGSSLG